MTTDTDTLTAVAPFTIAIPEAALDDLRARLAATRFPPQLPGEEWAKGVTVAWMQRAVAHWRDGFDWRAVEERLNTLPQIVTEIDGQRIHAVHVRSAHVNATPLLLLHGWPGSFLEFEGVIELLTDPTAHGGTAADAFHLVIPSLPGHGFSVPLEGEGWTDLRMGEALGELMLRLGYDRFGVQGGDAGAFVGPQVGRVHPDRVIGVHVNALVTFPGEGDDPDDLTPAEQQRAARQQHFGQEMSAYATVQGTRPQTLSFALADSPAGQLAWIAEKFREWSDPAAVLTDDPAFLDTLLADVSLYWFTNSSGSSGNLYWESTHSPDGWMAPREISGVPTAVLVSETQDVAIRRYAERENRVVRWTTVQRGGHFLALENPAGLVDDVRAFFRGLR